MVFQKLLEIKVRLVKLFKFSFLTLIILIICSFRLSLASSLKKEGDPNALKASVASLKNDKIQKNEKGRSRAEDVAKLFSDLFDKNEVILQDLENLKGKFIQNELENNEKDNWDFYYKLIYLFLVVINLVFVGYNVHKSIKNRAEDRSILVRTSWANQLLINLGIKELNIFFDKIDEEIFSDIGNSQQKIDIFKGQKRILRSKFIMMLSFMSSDLEKQIELGIETIEDLYTTHFDIDSINRSKAQLIEEIGKVRTNIYSKLYSFHEGFVK